MCIGLLSCDISVEFGNALLALGLGAIAVFLVVVYVEKIIAGLGRWLRLLNPWALLARCRHWWLLHKATH